MNEIDIEDRFYFVCKKKKTVSTSSDFGLFSTDVPVQDTNQNNKVLDSSFGLFDGAEPEPVVDCVAIPVTPLASAVYAPSLVIVRPVTAPEFTLATVNVALVPVPKEFAIVNTSPTA